MRFISKVKLDSLLQFMEAEGIDSLLIIDLAYLVKDVNLRYLSGHPCDAALILKSSGEMILFPWDYALAKEYSEVDSIADLSTINNNWKLAVSEFFKENYPRKKPIVGVMDFLPYNLFQEFTSLPVIELYKKPNIITNFLNNLRVTKSEIELKFIKEAMEIGNRLLKNIHEEIEKNILQTELEFASFIFNKMKEYGAEDHAFPASVANITRSHHYHAFPPVTLQKFKQKGLAIIDFGAQVNGYCSNITLPISFGKLSEKQNKMKNTVIKAFENAVEAIHVGVKVSEIEKVVANVINTAGFKHNIAVGHGLGLTPLEAPRIRKAPATSQKKEGWKDYKFKNGMVFTIEPAIYSKGEGGVRLKNDFFIQNNKLYMGTKSQFWQF